MIGLGRILGFTSSAAVIFETPVGLSTVSNNAAIFYTGLNNNSIQYTTLSASYKVTPELTLGIGYASETIPNLDLTGLNSTNEIIANGTFDSTQSQIVIGGAWKFNQDLATGLSITHYQHKIYTTQGSGDDLNVGLTYNFPWVSTNWFITNFFANKINYTGTANETLSRSLAVSLCSYPTSFYLSQVFGQFKLTDDGSLLKSLGTRFSPTDSDDFYLSLALRDAERIDQSIRTSLSIGVILYRNPITIEYAFDTTEVYQDDFQHYFSVSVSY